MSNHHKLYNSTSIKHIDYDDDSDTLIICFTSGATYHYPECHKDHYHNLKTAASAGAYFQKHLRGLKADRQ